MKRKIPILITAIAILIACAVPAFAADIDYNDHVTNVESDGTTDTVSVSVPSSAFTAVQWRLYNANLSGVGSTLGTSATFTYAANTNFAIGCAPFSGDFLDLRDIPDGTTIDFLFDIYGNGTYTPPTQAKLILDYYDSTHTLVSSVQTDWDSLTYDSILTATISKPNDAAFVRITALKRYYVLPSGGSITLSLAALRFNFDINALTRLQQETGRTNKLLDQIMNGYDPDPETPPVNDDVDDMHQAEDEVLEQFQPDRVYDDLDDMTVTILDNLVLLANAFGLITLMFDALLGIPELGLLAYISLCLGLLAALLGIGVAVISSKGDK